MQVITIYIGVELFYAISKQHNGDPKHSTQDVTPNMGCQLRILYHNRKKTLLENYSCFDEGEIVLLYFDLVQGVQLYGPWAN